VAESLRNRLRHAWNAFQDQGPGFVTPNIGPSYSVRPDRVRLTGGSERSIISSIYTRIGIDVASVSIRHVRLDEDERYLETMSSALNECLTVEANVDQSSRSFIQDVVLSMFDEGCVAIIAVDTTIDPKISSGYDVQSMRTGKIVEWYPYHVRVNVYNERLGRKEDITLSKKDVAIVENPLYSVMNEPNSTLKRLINKLNILDAIDEQSGSGKLDLIIQLPYVIKTDARKAQAETRRADIETQLSGSKYGIAYTDGTEKITQLNRPTENNLMAQIEFLTSMLYSQLGLTPSIFDGSADEKTMINYHNRTIGPVLSSICDSMTRRFLTKTGRSQGQIVKYFRNPFGLVPATELATIADSLTRNAILSSNEFRSVMGYKPSKEAEADSLRNKNLNPTAAEKTPTSDPNGQQPNTLKGVKNDGKI
jgi:hypothetical protein